MDKNNATGNVKNNRLMEPLVMMIKDTNLKPGKYQILKTYRPQTSQKTTNYL